MNHIIVMLVTVIFGVAALICYAMAARQYRAREPVSVGDPPPPIGSARDKWNKLLTVGTVNALICGLSIVAWSLGR
ncbi:MAG: hypothetical protein J2P17_24285 [Mycobacterium sp.]|nr:hypothetical protein [Mycobacterium sp.]